MADVANDGAIFHLFHVLDADNVEIAGGGNVDVAFFQAIFHGLHFVTFHGGLQSTNRVDFVHDNASTEASHRLGATFTHIAITTNNGYFSGNHHVGGALDTVGQRFAATIQIVEFRFGHRVVHVESREEQFFVAHHLVQTINARSGFFRYTFDFGHHGGPEIGLFGQNFFQDGFQFQLVFAVRRSIQNAGIFFGLYTQMYHQSSIAAIINNQVGTFAAFESERLQSTPPIFFQTFAFPRKHIHASFCHSGSGMVLGRENVTTGPTHFGTQFGQGFNQHGSLDSHVQRTHNASTFQRLLWTIFLADSHQSGHFFFGNFYLFSTEINQGHIGYFVRNFVK